MESGFLKDSANRLGGGDPRPLILGGVGTATGGGEKVKILAETLHGSGQRLRWGFSVFRAVGCAWLS
jgi:hypothetical protein